LLQLLERSENAHALVIKLSETPSEICYLLIEGVVRHHPRSRIQDKAEDRCAGANRTFVLVRSMFKCKE
jgi:hypothetical protein